jgi:opacity protein-like surface antigen
MKKTLLALVAILCFTFAASAADFSGKYMPDPSAAPAGGGGGRGRGGGMATYEFKVSGSTLTGSITRMGRGGDPMVTPIADGKITGDTFTFSIMQAGRGGGDPMKVEYTGKVVGDKLEITTDRGNGPMTTTLVKSPTI